MRAMNGGTVCGFVFALCALTMACSSSSKGGGTSGTGVLAGSGGVGSGSGGSFAGSGVAGTAAGTDSAGTTSLAGSGGSGGISGSGAAGSAGAAGAAGAAGTGSAGTTAGTGSAGTGAAGTGGGTGNSLTGTLGALGPVQPILHGFATTNGLETLIYLTTADISCDDLKTMGTPWLSKTAAGTQTIEIVVKGTAMVGTVNVGGFSGGEINFAAGNKSSSYETNADSGSITFTKADAMSVFEGSITAMYGANMLSGMFHADWCQGGSEW